MQSKAKTPSEYLAGLPEDRKKIMGELRKTIRSNVPKGFVEEMSYGMIGYVVPHSLYPKGYHCDPRLPLPFISFASQKNYISLYHMGLYSDGNLLSWLIAEYPRHSKAKLDMGKCCIRFKNPELIPLLLIGELASKMTPAEWIAIYEKQFGSRAK